MTLQPQEKAIMTTLIGTSRTERSSRTTPTSHNGPTIYISQGKHHTCIYCRQRSGCIWNTAAYEDAFCEQVIHYIYYYFHQNFSFHPFLLTYLRDILHIFEWPSIEKNTLTTIQLQRLSGRTEVHQKLQCYWIAVMYFY